VDAVKRQRLGFALHHARAGDHIVIVVDTHVTVRLVMRQIAAMVGTHPADERIHRASGLEGYEHVPTGGSIRFVTTAALDRITHPIAADKVLVDPAALLTDARERVLADMCRGERV
jgi:hypothetical protein